MATCPYCAESIAPTVSVCPYCGSRTAGSRSSSQTPHPEADLGMRMLLPVGRSGWAIAAGYLGLFSVLCLPAPFAILVAGIAIWDIRNHPEKHGMGRAMFGLVMGILGTLLCLFSLVAAAFR